MKRVSINLSRHSGDFGKLTAALIALSDNAPHRMTLSQAVFFLAASTAILRGERPTYTDIKNAVGDEVNRSLKTTYRVLLEPSRLYPKALHWLDRAPNPDDNREKFLVLTPAGKRALGAAAEALDSKS